MSTLNKITLTGADTNTDIKELVLLSQEFPLVEWGILFSYDRMGTERYPTLKWITNFIQTPQPNINRSLHLCGSSVHNFLDNEPIIRAIAKQFDRVQLNFNNKRTPISPFDIRIKFLAFSGIQPDIIITQHNENNAELWKEIDHQNHHILFDASGGEGKLLNVEPPLPHKYCGYAGGIGPDNVVDVIKQIDTVNTKLPYYIDMESSLRTNGQFDIGKCRSVLTQVYDYISHSRQ